MCIGLIFWWNLRIRFFHYNHTSWVGLATLTERPKSVRTLYVINVIIPKNTNSIEDVILLPVKCRWITFSGFRKISRKCPSQSVYGQPSCFSERPETHRRGRGRLDLPYQVSEEKSKIWKVDDRRTDDGQRVITILQLSLRLGCTK